MAFIERKIVKYVTLKIEQKSCSEGTKSHVTEYLWKSWICPTDGKSTLFLFKIFSKSQVIVTITFLKTNR